MTALTIGSLFSGYGGLDMGAAAAVRWLLAARANALEEVSA